MIEDLLKNKTDDEKLKFLYRVSEKLRLEHNNKGKDFKDGVITKVEFNTYIKNNFLVKQKIVLREINLIKDALDFFNPDKRDEIQTLKEVGKKANNLDKDIDITKL
jgi:hypothetical protein